MTVGEHLTVERGVRSARSRANAETTLKVDPGAARPTVARDCPRLPWPFAAATIAPVEGRMATRALAGLVFASVFSASFCSPMLSVVVSGLPDSGLTSNSTTGSGSAAGEGVGDGLAELPLGLAAASRTSHTGRAAHLCVVALLQSGQPHLVSGNHRPAGIVDVFLCCLADDPDDGSGKVAGRARASGRCGWRALPGWHGFSSRVAGPVHPCAARWPERKRCYRQQPPSIAYALGLILTTLASRIADAFAFSPLTFDLSIPIRNTGRSTTMGTPSSPSSCPRSG